MYPEYYENPEFLDQLSLEEINSLCSELAEDAGEVFVPITGEDVRRDEERTIKEFAAKFMDFCTGDELKRVLACPAEDMLKLQNAELMLKFQNEVRALANEDYDPYAPSEN